MSIAAYDTIAEWYDQSIRTGSLLAADDLILSDLFRTIGDIEGMSVCDLACGQGKMARQMASRGAKVIGIDIAQKLLDIARSEEESNPQGITYVRDDAQLLISLSEESVDGVLCNMALMDIPDLKATLDTVRRVLRPEGWFAFTITHPCFQTPPDGYYAEGFWRSDNPHGVRGQVGANHRTISTYLNTLSESGMIAEHLSEPQLPGRETPVVLTVFCRKAKA